MNEIVSVSNTTKHFQQKTAVNNISFSMKKRRNCSYSRTEWGREDDRHLHDPRIAETE